MHKTTALIVTGLMASAVTLTAAESLGTSTQGRPEYRRPYAPSTPPALLALPPGTVEPAGWLRDWCLTACDGYTARMDEVDAAFKQAWSTDYKMPGPKLSWNRGGWPYEGGGYWFDGLAKLGFILHDEALIKQAKTRFDQVVTNMTDKGILFLWWLDRNNPEDLKYGEGLGGCNAEWPIWASGLFGRALAGYYAGSKEASALRALERAYSGERRWVRMGFAPSNLGPAFDTYTWTGNKAIGDAITEFFTQGGVNKGNNLENWNRYGQMPHDQPWSDPTDHGVHMLESTAWALGYLWTGKSDYLDAILRWHDNLERDAMQPCGVPVSDEFTGPPGAARHIETCSVSAYIWSQAFLMALAGQGNLGDRLERAFFNAVPAVVTRDFKEHLYLQPVNRVAPGQGQRRYNRKQYPLCCTATLNRMLPNYVVNMWMATGDNGLAATCYGPCRVSALVADGVPVEVASRTDYPFGESIEMTVKPARQARFPLSFRVPGWCRTPAIAVNGVCHDTAGVTNGFLRIERSWQPGDVVKMEFPMPVRVDTGRDPGFPPVQHWEVLEAKYRDKIASAAPYATVSLGPLLFVLPIADTQNANTPDPAAKWNYALTDTDSAGKSITVERGPMPARWDWPLASPLKLRARGVRFDWSNPQVLPPRPVEPVGTAEEIILIPYGCTKFRVSMFPVAKSLR